MTIAFDSVTDMEEPHKQGAWLLSRARSVRLASGQLPAAWSIACVVRCDDPGSRYDH